MLKIRSFNAIDSFSKVFVLILVTLILLSVSACSKKTSYVLLGSNDYTLSLQKYYDAVGIQKVEQSVFEVKLMSLYSMNQGDLTFYFYDLLLAPKVKMKYGAISIEIAPDYKVHPLLKSYFEDKSQLIWKTFDVRPSTITKDSLENISYNSVVGNVYGSIIIQGYLCDGGEGFLNEYGLSKAIAKKAIEQMIVTIKMNSNTEIFHFAAIGKTNVLDQNVAKVLAKNNIVIKTFLDGGLTLKYGKFGEEVK